MTPMYDYAIEAAFSDAVAETYIHMVGLDPHKIARHCEQVINALSEQIDINTVELANATDDREEEWREQVLRESFVRVFEAGLRVGLEAGEEGVEVRIHISRDQITGLVQSALQAALEPAGAKE